MKFEAFCYVGSFAQRVFVDQRYCHKQLKPRGELQRVTNINQIAIVSSIVLQIPSLRFVFHLHITMFIKS